MSRDREDRPLLPRRQFLSTLAALPALAPALWASRIVRSSQPRIEEMDFNALEHFITPQGDFYIRDHFREPRLGVVPWRLKVAGRVRKPLELSYAELVRQPARDLTVTLECAANPVGAGGVSTAVWTGIPLRALLEHAGLHPGVKFIRLVGADHGSPDGSDYFLRSIPIAKALRPETLVVLRINGAPLPAEHGYPVRALVSGWYAMDSVKWLTRIEALDEPDTSPAMTQQYVAVRLETVGAERTPVTRMRIKSQISWPRDGQTIAPGHYAIRGAAWAGEDKIAKVEVSTDGGKTWAPASLQQSPALYSWVLWRQEWNPSHGEYRILARATDDQGNSQPLSRSTTRLDGYEMNWCQVVRCTVR